MGAIEGWTQLVDLLVVRASEGSFVVWRGLLERYVRMTREASYAGAYLSRMKRVRARGRPWATPKAKAKGKAKAKAKAPAVAKAAPAGVL